MRPNNYKMTFHYAHQTAKTVEVGRDRVVSVLRSARADGCFVEKGESSGAMASRYKIQDGTTEIIIKPDHFSMPSHIEVFYVGRNEGWATIIKDMNHSQMGEADFTYRKREAVEWAKKLQRGHQGNSCERRGMSPMPIYVFTKEGIKRVL